MRPGLCPSGFYAVLRWMLKARKHSKHRVAAMKKGWQTKTLDEISTNLDSRRVPITKSDRVGGEYPYYGASGMGLHQLGRPTEYNLQYNVHSQT